MCVIKIYFLVFQKILEIDYNEDGIISMTYLVSIINVLSKNNVVLIKKF